MRSLIVSTLLLGLLGACTVQNTDVAPAPDPIGGGHPRVMIEGIDGTVLYGRLLNPTITVESGQGPLTLLTDHVKTIHISDNGDTVDGQSVQVSGQLKDETFQLKNEHGVIPLLTERLRRITFLDIQSTAPATAPAATPTRTVPTTSGHRRLEY